MARVVVETMRRTVDEGKVCIPLIFDNLIIKIIADFHVCIFHNRRRNVKILSHQALLFFFCIFCSSWNCSLIEETRNRSKTFDDNQGSSTNFSTTLFVTPKVSTASTT